MTDHLRHLACQLRRGAGTLPHLGRHPGWPIFFLLTALGAGFGLATLSL